MNRTLRVENVTTTVSIDDDAAAFSTSGVAAVRNLFTVGARPARS